MEIKAVFFDIDGTLVPFGDHDIPQEVKNAIRTLRDKGIKVFIATGRHANWIDNIGDTKFDGYVTVNGGMSLLSDKKTIIYTHPIATDDIHRLIESYKAMPLEFCLVPADGDIFISGINDYAAKACKLINIPPIPIKPLECINGKDVVQMMAFGEEKDWSDPTLYSAILKNCDATSWNPYFCDIVPKGSCKSIGIDRMLEYFDIPLNQTLAFGDGDNDISMIKHCHIGIAMGNASDNVKSVADYITTDVRNHGVVEALKHIGLIP